MYFKYGFLVSVIFAVSGIVRTDNGFHKMNVSIFYESLDPSSVKFFMDNFNSSSVKMYGSFINLHFVPFGRSKLEIGQEEDKVTPRITMTCEHGEVECFGNKQHGCALKYTPNPEDAMNYIICTMRNTDVKTVTTNESYPVEKCNSLLKDLNDTAFNTCLSATNESVMEEYKKMTDAVGVLDTLPVITLEHAFDAKVSKDLVSNFHKALCTRLANTTGIEKICGDILSGNSSTPNTKPSSAAINSVTYLPTVLAIIVFVFFNVKLQ